MTTNFEIFRDRTAIWNIQVTQAGKTLDITGMTLTMTARQTLTGATIFVKDNAGNGGITVSDAPGGVASVELLPSDTLALSNVLRTELFYDLMLTNGLRLWTLQDGQLIVKGNVT